MLRLFDTHILSWATKTAKYHYIHCIPYLLLGEGAEIMYINIRGRKFCVKICGGVRISRSAKREIIRMYVREFIISINPY